jgi:hypothetical protein
MLLWKVILKQCLGSDCSQIPRLLFRFVLKIFYGTIVIENADLIPETGRPWYGAYPFWIRPPSLPVAF